MLLEDGEIFLRERHLQRIRNSASFFGFLISAELEQAFREYPSETAKLKVTLRKDGTVTTELSAIPNSENKRVALASAPVNSADRFLFHKTTNRDFYNAELAARPGCDDILFWNERGEVTESSIANLVVSIDDQLFTPPVSSGLLAGTFRDHLLAEGKVKERVITIEELKTAKQVFLINSVRKCMKASLVCEATASVSPCSSVAQL